MKKIILGLMGIFLVTVMSLALAYDQSTPYSATMKWIVPSDTTFTVSLCGAETTIDFDTNLTSSTQVQVEPDCQNAPAGIPIMNITNSGNINMNFTCNLTAPSPSWAYLYVNNNSNFLTAKIVNVTAVTIANGVATSGTSLVYVWTNVTNAVQGTTTKTFEVFSKG